MFQKLITVLFVILSFVAVQVSLKKQLPDGRIVGGYPVNITDFPHQISLELNNQHNCGGSIISEKYILTAGHCTDGRLPAELSIRANTSVLGTGGVHIVVSVINQHPNFDFWNLDYDISILELSEPLQFGVGIQPIQLPLVSDIIAAGTEVTITGWGSLSEGGAIYPLLQAVQVNIVDHTECQNLYWSDLISERMLCAGVPEGGKDSCQGDSGGPLISQGIQYGIVSWGDGCGRPDTPGVYTDVASLRDFITEITGI